jgi:hypothetical protein
MNHRLATGQGPRTETTTPSDLVLDPKPVHDRQAAIFHVESWSVSHSPDPLNPATERCHWRTSMLQRVSAYRTECSTLTTTPAHKIDREVQKLALLHAALIQLVRLENLRLAALAPADHFADHGQSQIEFSRGALRTARLRDYRGRRWSPEKLYEATLRLTCSFVAHRVEGGLLLVDPGFTFYVRELTWEGLQGDHYLLRQLAEHEHVQIVLYTF